MTDRAEWILVFQTNYDIMMPSRFLVGFREIGTHSRTYDDCYVSSFRSGFDNFNGIRVIDFLNPFNFYESSGYRLYSYNCISYMRI